MLCRLCVSVTNEDAFDENKNRKRTVVWRRKLSTKWSKTTNSKHEYIPLLVVTGLHLEILQPGDNVSEWKKYMEMITDEIKK